METLRLDLPAMVVATLAMLLLLALAACSSTQEKPNTAARLGELARRALEHLADTGAARQPCMAAFEPNFEIAGDHQRPVGVEPRRRVAGGRVAMDAQVGGDEGTDEPAPDRALMIGAVARNRVAATSSPSVAPTAAARSSPRTRSTPL